MPSGDAAEVACHRSPGSWLVTKLKAAAGQREYCRLLHHCCSCSCSAHEPLLLCAFLSRAAGGWNGQWSLTRARALAFGVAEQATPTLFAFAHPSTSIHTRERDGSYFDPRAVDIDMHRRDSYGIKQLHAQVYNALLQCYYTHRTRTCQRASVQSYVQCMG